MRTGTGSRPPLRGAPTKICDEVAICHGPWVLCSTTALKGRRVTCFHSIKDDVTNAGGTYVDEEVCIDGNVITNCNPEDLPAFVVAIIELMRKGE